MITPTPSTSATSRPVRSTFGVDGTLSGELATRPPLHAGRHYDVTPASAASPTARGVASEKTLTQLDPMTDATDA